MDEIRIAELQNKLGYEFKEPSLLETALTHSSYANENKKSCPGSNERMEFLGDSVLGMTVAAMIYAIKPDIPEGGMTQLRSELVCEKSLASLAASFGFGEYLQLGHGEEKSGGRKRPSILADCTEAVIAAMYLDGGFPPIERFVNLHLNPQANLKKYENTDYKTSLQEIIQEKPGQTLTYHVAGESGPDHMKTFEVEVRLNGDRIGAGTGRSKKEAEQASARDALSSLTPNA